jgi:hypothetical protein
VSTPTGDRVRLGQPAACPVGCGRSVRVGHLMCYPCWQEVPPDLKREVWRTWKRLERGVTDGDPLAEYEHARSAAIGAVS